MLSGVFDGRSAEGRYVRDLERQLTEHVGGAPSIAERLMIRHIVSLRLRLDRFEERLDSGEKWTACDDRTYGGCLNAFKNALISLGLEPTQRAEPTIEDIAADIVAGEEAGE